MKYLHLFSLLLLAIGLNSCNSIGSMVFNANGNKKFASQEAYFEKLLAQKKYAKEKIVFLSKSELDILMGDVIDKHLSTYYGIVHGDSFASADQLEDPSCPGQIATLYRKFERKDDAVVIDDASMVEIMKSLKLDPNKQTVVFIYSYKLGSLLKSKIGWVISELKENDNFDYRIVSLDNNDIVQQ